MKTILCLIGMMTAIGAFAARGQDANSDGKETAKATIARAEIAANAVSSHNEEFLSLCKKQEDGTKPLGDKEKKKLAQIWSEQKSLLELNRRIVDLIKVGESVFLYPGLLALSEVNFNQRDNNYSIRLVTDYRGYEGGMERHPTFQIVTFDEAGRITEIKELATVKMLTE